MGFFKVLCSLISISVLSHLYLYSALTYSAAMAQKTQVASQIYEKSFTIFIRLLNDMEACKWYLAFHLRLNPRDVVLKLWITKNSRQSNWLGSVSTPPIMNFRSCFTKWFRRCATIIVVGYIFTFWISLSSTYTIVLEWIL